MKKIKTIIQEVDATHAHEFHEIYYNPKNELADQNLEDLVEDVELRLLKIEKNIDNLQRKLTINQKINKKFNTN